MYLSQRIGIDSLFAINALAILRTNDTSYGHMSGADQAECAIGARSSIQSDGGLFSITKAMRDMYVPMVTLENTDDDDDMIASSSLCMCDALTWI
jgi:hypothetical protein